MAQVINKMELELDQDEISNIKNINSLRRISEISREEDDDSEYEDFHLYRLFDQTSVSDENYADHEMIDDLLPLRLFKYCCICELTCDELTSDHISWKTTECCYELVEEISNYDDSTLVFCVECLRRHATAKIEEGIPFIKCPGSVGCERYLKDSEIAEVVSEELFERLQRLREGLRMDPLKKTCPNCSKIKEVSDKNILQVYCVCGQIWCFQCHAPWHQNMSCKEFLRKDKSLKVWAKNEGKPERNAVRCPKCKIFIQRNGGCYHMTCNRCTAEFCYLCGGIYVDIWSSYLGDHHSKLSVFGCKHIYKPDNPIQRTAVRGTLFTGKVLVLPVAGTLLLGAGCVALAGLAVASPVLLSYKIAKKQKRKRNTSQE